MEQVTLGAVIIGLVNAIKLQFPKIQGIYGIALAIIIGGVMGYFGILAPDVQTGVIIGIASSGVYKISQKIGGE